MTTRLPILPNLQVSGIAKKKPSSKASTAKAKPAKAGALSGPALIANPMIEPPTISPALSNQTAEPELEETEVSPLIAQLILAHSELTQAILLGLNDDSLEVGDLHSLLDFRDGIQSLILSLTEEDLDRDDLTASDS